MKQLKILIIVILLYLCISTAGAIYEESMGEIEGEIVEQDTGFIYPTETIKQVSDALGGKWTLAEAIVIGCMNHSEDNNLCIKNVFGVTNAESSLSKNVGSSNNAFGWMYNGNLKRFTSIEEGIVQRIKLYEKNNRQTRGLSGKRWILGNYCVSECTNRISNYNYGIAIIESSLR